MGWFTLVESNGSEVQGKRFKAPANQVDAHRDGATGRGAPPKNVNHTQARKLAGALLIQLAGTEETVTQVVTEGTYVRAADGKGGDGENRMQPGPGSWPARATIAELPAAPRAVRPVQKRA